MKLWNSCRMAWLQAKRHPLFWVLLIGFYAYSFYCFYYYTLPSEYDAGAALSQLSFLVQGGILVFLFLGVVFIRTEEAHSLNDLMSTIQGGAFSKAAGKLLFGCLFILFLCTTVFFAYALRIYVTGLELSHFYWSAYQYILLYWGFTFLISLLLGILFSLWIKGKLTFPVLLLVWTFIGPMNEEFIGSTTLRLRLTNLPLWLSLGDPNPHASYNALYGFALSPYHWMKHGVMFTIIVVLILLTLMGRSYALSKRPYYRSLALTVLLFAVLSYGLSLDRQLYLSNNSVHARDTFDQRYYEKDRSFSVSPTKMKATNYDISLEIIRLLQANVTFTLTNEGDQPIREAVLSLYHGFDLKSVKSGDTPLSFSQKGDEIKVTLKHPLQPEEKVRIAMRYAGSSSPLFFANERAVYLPYYFPWLPSTQTEPAFQTVESYGLNRVNHQSASPTSYKLSFKGTRPLYSNLIQTGKNEWQGTAPKGLTLVSGELVNKSLGDTRFIEPNTWVRNLTQFGEYHQQTEKIIKHLSKLLNQPELKMPKTIMYFPILSTSDTSFEEFMWYGGDHLIYGVPINGKTMLPDRSIYTYWIVPALTWKHAGVQMTQDPDYITSFDQSLSYVYNKEFGIQDDGSFLPASFKGSTEKRNALITTMKWLKTDGNYSRKLAFCREWLELIKQDRDWSALSHLIEKYSKAEEQ